MFDPGFSLEIINGAGLIVGLFFIWHLARYLYIETKRRNLTLRAWLFKLPISMHFGVAILVYDIGVEIKTGVVWIWRAFYGAQQFNMPMLTALWIGSFIIVVGSLCKIRAITKPDRGDVPWLAAACAVALFVIVTVVQRNFLQA